MKRGKKLGLHSVLELIKSGKSPSTISEDYKIPKQTLQYSVDKLKKLGCIERESYGVWKYIKDIKEVPKRPKVTNAGQIGTSREVRGHAYIWKINFFGSAYDWLEIIKQYKRKLKRPKLTFQLICNKKVARTIFNSRKVWLTREGMIIYEPIDFLGKSSFQVKGMAVFEMDRLVKGIIKELRQKLRPYRFTTSKEHYGLIKNELANQYNDRREKMVIKNEYGTTWLWIDNSLIRGFRPGEMETKDPIINRQLQNHWNSHRRHNFNVDADFITNSLNETSKQIKANAGQLDYYGKNMVTHVQLMKNIDRNLGKQTNLFEEIAKFMKDINKN